MFSRKSRVDPDFESWKTPKIAAGILYNRCYASCRTTYFQEEDDTSTEAKNWGVLGQLLNPQADVLAGRVVLLTWV